MTIDGAQLDIVHRTLVLLKLGIAPAGQLLGLIPAGGLAGQVLEKNTNADYDVSWQTVSGGGSSNLDGGLSNSTYNAVSPIDGGNA